jgi:hypothetical protein
MGPNVAVLDWRGFHFCLAFSRQRTSSNLVSSYFPNYDLVHTDAPETTPLLRVGLRPPIHSPANASCEPPRLGLVCRRD